MSLSTHERRVRLMENDIESKLTSLSKLNTSDNATDGESAFEVKCEELRNMLDK
ncbi:hypothetical protein SARC_13824, partial [Sphaeroforma arctica JP610]